MFTFRIPIETLSTYLPEMGAFPFAPGEVSYNGPTLFVKGSKSPYVKEEHREIIKTFFPHAVIVGIEAGHWGEYLVVMGEGGLLKSVDVCFLCSAFGEARGVCEGRHGVCEEGGGRMRRPLVLSLR